MKICTACNSSYSDETLSFCPVDGTTLTPQKDVSLDQVPFLYEPGNWSETEEPATNRAGSFTNPAPPVTAASSTPSSAASQNISAAPGIKTNRGSSLFPVIFGSIAFAVLAGGLAFIFSGGSSSRSNPEIPARYGNTVTLANGTSVRAEPDNRTTANTGSVNIARAVPPSSVGVANVNAATNAANSVVAGKPISRKTEFTGIWQGKFSDESTVLSITTQTGDTFSGTLSKKGYIIKINGKVDFDKGTIEITETKVLQTPPNLNWNLGTNSGTIFGDGRSMSGTGRDKNGSYSWSFTKD